MTPATPTTPDTTAITDAVARSSATRESVRAQSPHDPARREALEAALGSLRATWTPEHERYVRSGRRVGRTTSADPVRVAKRERTAEMKRLRSMLHPTSGTPRQPPAEWTPQQMGGRLSRFEQVMKNIANQLELAQTGRHVGDGPEWVRVGEQRKNATELLEELRTERRSVQQAWQRYERHLPEHNAKRPYAARDTYERLHERLALLRHEADDLTADLRAAIAEKPRAIERRPWDFTDAADVIACLHEHRQKHGRLPTKAELNADPVLPFYTQVRRALGARPLSLL